MKERYVEILRPLVKHLIALNRTVETSLTEFNFRSMYGVEHVTTAEYIEALTALQTALESAKVIVRLDLERDV